jgi:hypothetical protein
VERFTLSSSQLGEEASAWEGDAYTLDGVVEQGCVN